MYFKSHFSKRYIAFSGRDTILTFLCNICSCFQTWLFKLFLCYICAICFRPGNWFLHSVCNLCAVICGPVIIFYISCVTFVRVFSGMVIFTFQNKNSSAVVFRPHSVFLHFVCSFVRVLFSTTLILILSVLHFCCCFLSRVTVSLHFLCHIVTQEM